jgi:thiamine pyrophosphate-dependent acetolactate synthase large subunit-like protein
MPDTQQLLKEGLSDAIGFIGGALAGYWLARLIGFDAFAQGYNSSSIVGILAVGLGGGMGLQAARRWRAAQARKD